MNHTTQATPDDHVPCGNNFSTRIDIPKNHNVTCKLNSCPGTKRTTQEQGSLFTQIIHRKLTTLFWSRFGNTRGQAKKLSGLFGGRRFTDDCPKRNATLRKLITQIYELIDMQNLARHIQRQTRTLKKSRLPIYLFQQSDALLLPGRIVQRDEQSVT